MAYWHSDTVTGYVTVDVCPACLRQHKVVVLYWNDEHVELHFRDLLNDVLLPCGTKVDLIYEWTPIADEDNLRAKSVQELEYYI